MDISKKTFKCFRCAENNRRYTQCHEGILQNVENIEENLFQVIRQKLTSLADCTEQHLRFSVGVSLRVSQQRLRTFSCAALCAEPQ